MKGFFMGYWNDWYLGWGWFLWFGVIFLALSSLGNWGYTYRIHRRFDPNKDALDYLNERFARGEITRDDYLETRTHILDSRDVVEKAKKAQKNSMVVNQRDMLPPASSN